MLRFIQYYSRFESARGQFATLPSWARFIVGIFALPGIILAALSIVALGVSILALLLLTVPVYRLLAALIGNSGEEEMIEATVVQSSVIDPPRRKIEVKIVE